MRDLLDDAFLAVAFFPSDAALEDASSAHAFGFVICFATSAGTSLSGP